MQYTNQQIRTALLKAADQIEHNPESYSFKENGKPNACGTPGCMIGWLGVFLGVAGDPHVWVSAVHRAVGFKFDDIMDTWNDYTNSLPGDEWDRFYRNGMTKVNDPRYASAAMRHFADMYYPAPPERKTAIPAEVLSIFDPEEAY